MDTLDHQIALNPSVRSVVCQTQILRNTLWFYARQVDSGRPTDKTEHTHTTKIRIEAWVFCPKKFELFCQYFLNNLLVFNILSEKLKAVSESLFKPGKWKFLFCFFRRSTKLADTLESTTKSTAATTVDDTHCVLAMVQHSLVRLYHGRLHGGLHGRL